MDYTKPQTKDDWKHNAQVAQQLFDQLLDEMTEEEKKGAYKLCLFHTGSFMFAGHKALGRIYNGIGKQAL